jgi:3-phosphoshikimate 1-carboxyvinyltransferase
MQKSIISSKIKGSISAYPSKSHFQRALICSIFASGTSTFNNIPFSLDSLIALNGIKTLGADFKIQGNSIDIKREKINSDLTFNLGESGFCSRVFPIVSSVFDGKKVFVLSDNIQRRIIEEIPIIFNSLGLKYEVIKNKLIVYGKIQKNEINLDSVKSSQYLSGLLIALPYLNQNISIKSENLNSKYYINLTLDVLKDLNISVKNHEYHEFDISDCNIYEPVKLKIEGDWSGAANFLVAGAIAGEISISGLNLNSKQPDRVIIKLLKKIGATVKLNPKSVTISRNNLKAFKFDASDYPDLIPALIPLALNCDGKSIILGVDRLINKETNRLQELIKSYSKLGAKMKYEQNKLYIFHSKLKGGNVNAKNDHRLAMSYSIAALNSKNPVNIECVESVMKSYPTYWDDFESIREENEHIR